MQHGTSSSVYPWPICYAFNLLIHSLARWLAAWWAREHISYCSCHGLSILLARNIFCPTFCGTNCNKCNKSTSTCHTWMPIPATLLQLRPLYIQCKQRQAHVFAVAYPVFDFVCFTAFTLPHIYLRVRLRWWVGGACALPLMKNGRPLFICSPNIQPANSHI